jgi:hypothetical protein
MTRLKLLTTFLLAVALACGKRGDPTPPVPVIPAAVSDLTATQRGPYVILSWTYPSVTTAGRSLSGIQRVHVYRYVEVLPGSMLGREPETLGDIPVGVPIEVTLFSHVPSLPPTQFLRLKETLVSLEPEDLSGVTEGGKLFYEDDPQMRTAEGLPVRVTYGVVTEAEARSDLSNLAVIVPLDVPTAPQSLSASISPDAVNLSWNRPAGMISGASDLSLIGYHVYRFTGDEVPETPITAAPVEKTNYADTPALGSHRYLVTAVRTTGPPLLQSYPSNVLTVEYRDLLPPPAPIGLTALPEDNAIRLIWDPVEAADLAGYKVYRIGVADQVGELFVTVTPTAITETNYRDTGVRPNTVYQYLVSSIDKSGNESSPTKITDVIIRK